MSSRRGLLLILAFAVLIRLPFLGQAIQGDDDIYLTEGAHAQIEPWHPLHTTYVFRGERVDLRGHTHPPLDGWVLGALIALFGGVNEVGFHAAYIGFTLLAAASMWSLARRFSPRPVWATLLLLATPVFVVNGNSFEADVPFVALWMAAMALFCAGSRFWAAVIMALAALSSYQVVLIVPILAAWLLLSGADHLVRARPPGRALLPFAWLAAPILVLVAWQLFERWGTGVWPLAVTLGYQKSYQTGGQKLTSALTLAGHALFLAGPLLTPLAIVAAWRRRHDRDTQFLLAWIGIFFAGSAVIFYAGSARYLLPMAAPVAILASASFNRPGSSPFLRILTLAGFASQIVLGLGLAAVNYRHWDGYRQFAANLPMGHRTWVNGEWGLRYYVERRGGLALTKDQSVQPGEIVVSSDLSRAVEVQSPLTPVVRMLEIRPAIPLRLIGLESHSGYSTASLGFWPFGISSGVIDRVRAEAVGERHVTREYLNFTATPDFGEQVVSGVYADHWMARTAMVLLKSPAAPRGFSVEFYLPPQASARRVELLLDGKSVVQGNYSKDGVYTLAAAGPLRGAGAAAEAEVEVDSTFFAPGDQRPLGIVLLGIGFR
jgi:hypothetical protein